MKPLIMALAIAVPASLLLISSAAFLLLRCCKRRRPSPQISHTQPPASPPSPSEDTIQAAISKFHLSQKSGSKPSLRFHQLHHRQLSLADGGPLSETQLPPPFSWQDHPRLISEAVESGWIRFAFTAQPTAAPRMSPLWGLCGTAHEEEDGLITWETPPDSGSTEFMQTVRINPGAVKKSGSVNTPTRLLDDSVAVPGSGFIRMSLPLPGPPLVGTSFSQEAYFEISVLYLQPLNRAWKASKRAKDGPGEDGHEDHMKLIEEEEEVSGVQSKISSPFSTVKSVAGNGTHRNSLVSVGLTRGGPILGKPGPGLYPGSIGFHSNGCVYLDGKRYCPHVRLRKFLLE